MHSRINTTGFTLIELSIVLVIIGLIVGGILVGRDLISAAEVRAQVSQIEKFQQAVNTFKGKYGSIPGDISDRDATNFGLATLGSNVTASGILESPNPYFDVGIPSNANYPQLAGEQTLFWTHLSQAKLVEGNFSHDSTSFPAVDVALGSQMAQYLPPAKIGSDASISAYSGDVWTSRYSSNYFHLAKQWYGVADHVLYEDTVLTVQQAYAIDKKIDDGLPQYGHTLALTSNFSFSTTWANGANHSSNGQMSSGASGAGGGPIGPSDTTAVSANSGTCYDNGNSAGAIAQYSVTWANGALTNCALSFKFQ